jgi:magnesium-transporting ATPase (P-type)
MLTGDKLETAENIGYSCKLLKNDMAVWKISTKTDV